MSEARASGDAIAPELKELSGVIPILVTPFDDHGEVDLGALSQEIEFLVHAGVRWAGFGFGSEVHRLGDEQLFQAVKQATETAGQRLSVFGNVELRSVAGAVEQATRAEQAGARLVLLRPGGFPGVSQAMVIDMIRELTAATSLGVIIQDAPQNTGVDLSPATLAYLLQQVDGVAALKIEPVGPARKIGAVLAELGAPGGRVIGGAGGGEYLHELARGACGTMPGPAYPEVFAAITRLHAKGERQQAFEMFARLSPLLTLAKRDMDTFLYVQKYVLMQRDVLDNANLGRPHGELDPRLGDEIDEVLDSLNLIAFFDSCRDVGW